MSDLVFKHLTSEPLLVILPSDHRLAALEAISPRDIEGETFVNVSDTAPTLRVVIDDYLRKLGLSIPTAHEAAKSVHGRIIDSFDTGRRLVARLRAEFFAPIGCQPAIGGYCSND
jgi:DNA-binding transcriptional LysR family regulator